MSLNSYSSLSESEVSMARKDQLREQRTNTVINVTSKKQESDIIQALERVVVSLQQEFGARISLIHERQWYLKDIIADLRRTYPDVDFHHHFDTSFMSPDGGILYIEGNGDNLTYPILISEVKNQGTNDLRTKEGLPRQPKGNAIERLGKNLIGLRVALMKESIFPFVCFGYGCDFEQGSSILDRISTMAMFGRLTQPIYTMKRTVSSIAAVSTSKRIVGLLTKCLQSCGTLQNAQSCTTSPSTVRSISLGPQLSNNPVTVAVSSTRKPKFLLDVLPGFVRPARRSSPPRAMALLWPGSRLSNRRSSSFVRQATSRFACAMSSVINSSPNTA